MKYPTIDDFDPNMDVEKPKAENMFNMIAKAIYQIIDGEILPMRCQFEGNENECPMFELPNEPINDRDCATARKEGFKSEVNEVAIVKKYDKKEVENFVNYWTEPNRSGKKMLFEIFILLIAAISVLG